MNEKISLQDLVVLLTEKSNLNPKDAETLVKECFDIMEEGLVNDKFLKIRNLGTFQLAWAEDSESLDVSTGETVLIPAHYKVTFAPDIELAAIINAPYASMETVEIEDTEYREKIEDALDDSDDEAEDEANENSAKFDSFWSRPGTQKESESIGAEGKPEEPEVIAKPEEQQEESETVESKPEEPKIIEIAKEKPEDKKEKFEKEEYIEDKDKGFEKEEESEYDEDHSRIGANKGLFWFLVLIISGLILFFAVRYFYPKIQTSSTPNSVLVFSSSTSRSDTDADNVETAQENGSATIQAVDTQKKNQTQNLSKTETPTPPAATVPEVQKAESQPAETNINTYYMILKGERLNTIALREYGHKAFWVYIYDENREIIDDPDVVEPGTIIYIPPAKKYGINKDDPESVDKALILQQQYKNR